jgi:ABC-type multidrug transport system ATPase subunit
MTRDARVEFEKVGFSFGSRPVLRDISFSLEPGDVAALTGPNGSGKSTLLKLAAGRLRPRRGRVSVTGSVCYVPTRLEFHDRLTVDEEVRYLTGVGRLRLSAVMDSLDRWEMTPHLGTEIADLSSGQRQRVSLAIASAWQPGVVLLDEPTANVDEKGRLLIADWLLELRASGAAVIAATHDLTSEAFGTMPRLGSIAL